jgi:lipid-binding SYLF domain-containing protein
MDKDVLAFSFLGGQSCSIDQLAVVLLSSLLPFASGSLGFSADEEHQYRYRATKAAEVLDSLSNTPDNWIPAALLRRADAIAVIPDMVKVTSGAEDTYGRGLLSERTTDGRWSAPAFITIAGGQFGQQLGATAKDLVLVISNKTALNSLLNGTGVKLGVDAGVLAGPIGQTEEPEGTKYSESAIFAYVRSNGVFSGIALNGELINIDQSSDERVYGRQISTDDILTRANLASNVSVFPFTEALNRVIPDKPTES